MPVEEIEVTIGENGEVQIEVHGVTGMSCLDITAGLEAALGGEIESREMKDAAYASEEQQTWDRQSLGGG
jgi:hypothetical protein